MIDHGLVRSVWHGHDDDFTKISNCDPQGRAGEASPVSSAAFTGHRKGWSDYAGAGIAAQKPEGIAEGDVQDRHPGKAGPGVKILMDSSGWIEFFTEGPLAERYAAYFSPRHDRIIPTIVLYEVYKKIKRERGEETALLVSGQLSASHVVQLTESIAYLAADMSLLYGLAMADAIVYATARDQDAQVVTGDADLKDLPGVIYVK